MGRRRDAFLKACRYCGAFFDRKVLPSGQLERLSSYKQHGQHTPECEAMLSLGLKHTGLTVSPAVMEKAVNDFFDAAADAVEAMLVEAERIRLERPKDADRLRLTAARLQEARIKVITRKAPMVIALSRRSPASSA